jgi:predicted ferric reductase
VDPREAPGYMTAGWLAFFCFAAILVTSLFRKIFRLDYEWWRILHVVLAVAGVILAGWHMLGSGSYLEAPLKRFLWMGLLASWLGLTLWVRLVRPWRLSRRPYRVKEVRPEVGHTWTLVLEPEATPPFDYRAGQFAWVTLRASPFAMKEHPFSISSAPTRPGTLEFTIKELGDFTSTIGTVKPGEVAFVDGPYGNFGTDRHPDAKGFVFVVGGVGVAPAISMLRDLADRGDTRPHWIFYGNRQWDRVALRDEIDALAKKLDLTVVHVLLEPHAGWEGEVGFVSREVMERHLPADLSGLHFMVCGPTPMIRLVEKNLREMKVSLRRLHSEIFDLA